MTSMLLGSYRAYIISYRMSFLKRLFHTGGSSETLKSKPMDNGTVATEDPLTKQTAELSLGEKSDPVDHETATFALS